MKQVIKMQLSLETNLDAQQVLVYNEDRSIMYQQAVIPEILEIMKGRPKAYFYARMAPDKMLDILEEAPEQEW